MHFERRRHGAAEPHTQDEARRIARLGAVAGGQQALRGWGPQHERAGECGFLLTAFANCKLVTYFSARLRGCITTAHCMTRYGQSGNMTNSSTSTPQCNARAKLHGVLETFRITQKCSMRYFSHSNITLLLGASRRAFSSNPAVTSKVRAPWPQRSHAPDTRSSTVLPTRSICFFPRAHICLCRSFLTSASVELQLAEFPSVSLAPTCQRCNFLSCIFVNDVSMMMMMTMTMTTTTATTTTIFMTNEMMMIVVRFVASSCFQWQYLNLVSADCGEFPCTLHRRERFRVLSAPSSFCR